MTFETFHANPDLFLVKSLLKLVIETKPVFVYFLNLAPINEMKPSEHEGVKALPFLVVIISWAQLNLFSVEDICETTYITVLNGVIIRTLLNLAVCPWQRPFLFFFLFFVCLFFISDNIEISQE